MPATATILFDRDTGTSDDHVGAGWSIAEPGFRWTDGARAVLTLPRVGDGTAPVRLSLWAEPHLPAGTAVQRVAIEHDGAILHQETIDAGEIVTALLPAAANGGQVTLLLPDAASPGGGDTRLLGLSCRRLVVTATRAATSAQAAMERVASLGATAELGFVQRRLGAEPVDLLRFASSRLAPLVQGLETGFASIDDPALFAIEPRPDGRGHVGVHAGYALRYPVYLPDGEIALETVVDRELVRLRFLARRLITDVETGDRLFVWRADRADRTIDHVRPLVDALRLHNPAAALLYVDAGEPRRAAQVAPGLYHATLPRFAPIDDPAAGDDTAWLAACQDALALRG